jgi:nucleotide-binding universal stress UspA family protein
MSPASSPNAVFRRILFCTDFSGNADLAFDFALEQVRHSPDCTLCLLHVVPEPEARFFNTYLYEVDNVDSKAKQDMDEKIRAAYVSRLPAGVNMDIEIRGGTEADNILECAEEKKADLIIIGRQGRSSVGKVFFGNVTEKVVRKSRCPVLVVPLSSEAARAT